MSISNESSANQELRAKWWAGFGAGVIAGAVGLIVLVLGIFGAMGQL